MSNKTKSTRAELVRRRNAPRPPRAQVPRQRPMVERHDPKPEARKKTYRPGSLLLPGVPRPVNRQAALRNPYVGGPSRQPGRGSKRQRYDYSFTLADRNVRAPAIALPQINPSRLASGVLTLALAFLLYTMWTSSMFKVTGAELHGNHRLGAAEINAALRLVDQPIFKAMPSEIEANLRADYPDLSSVKVRVGFPNQVIVTVTEREPVITWEQDGKTFWIDADGVAFPVRGEASVLITVQANGNPPQLHGADDKASLTPAFLDPAMVQAMATLYPYIPSGTPMVYDPKYGMGWEEARGWSVYFGQNTDDIPMKIRVYQAVVDRLTGQGITPTLISVEYLQGPFYK